MSTGFKGPIVHGPNSTQEGYAYRNGMGMMSSAEFCVKHDDFVDAVATNVPAGWTGAIVDTGGTVTTNVTATVGANGVLTFADATASEGAAIYGAKAFQLISGKKFVMEIRVRTDDVTDNTIQFGLSDLTATSNPEDLWTTTAANVVAFGILDGSATTGVLCDAANAGTAVAAGTKAITADTWTTLAIQYDGSKINCFVNGDLSVSTSTTIPTATALAPFIGHINGNGAGGNLVIVDYVRILSER